MIGARILAFGTVDPVVWGVAWIPDGEAMGLIAVGAPEATAVLEARLAPEGSGAGWSVRGEGVSLAVSPATPARHATEPDGHLESTQAPCSVDGELTFAGTRHAVSCPGWQAAIRADLQIDQLESLRAVAGWIGRDDALALISLRPRQARGHERDVVLADVLEPDELPPVIDPRLSTTYAIGGVPARAGLELWFDEVSSEEDDAAEPHYPRRAAGEAVGAGIEWDVDGLSLHAQLLRWHTRGHDGAGVYLLGRRR